MSSALVTELLARINSGDLKGESEFKIRDENARTKTKVRKVPRIARELKKVSKLFFPAELAFPFNPLTGKADENFNNDLKYRPVKSVTTMTKVMKTLAEQTPALKETLMSRVGISEWDTSNSDVLTALDDQVMRPYRTTRQFTLRVVKITSKAVTGQDFGQEYVIQIERDKLGRVVGTLPVILKMNKLFRDLRQTEVDDWVNAERAAKQGQAYTIKSIRKELKGLDLKDINEKDFKEARSKIYQDNPTSDDYPVNYAFVYEFELTSDLEFDQRKQLPKFSVDDLDGTMRLVKLSSEITEALEKFKNGPFKNNDIYRDFFELDMECPESVDGDPKMDIPRKTRYTNPVRKLSDPDFAEFKDHLIGLVTNHQDSDEEIESRFMVSAYVKDLTPDIEQMMIEVVQAAKLLESPYLSKDVIKYNSDTLSMIYGQAADELKVLLDMDLTPANVSDAPLDQDAAAAASREALSFTEVLEGGLGEESQEVMGTESGTTIPAGEPVGAAAGGTTIEGENIVLD